MKYPKAKASQRIMLMLIFSLLVLYPIHTVFPQTSSNTTVAIKPSANTPLLGETITINITLTNVQNLYGLDITLQWNTSVLQVLNVNLRLGVESHSDGVLHGNRLADETSALPGDILVKENDASQELGQYSLTATSVAPAASFTGSGNIAIITFNVTSPGHSGLDLTTELADYNPSGSSFIDHSDINGTVDSVIPEFPNIAVLVLFLILATFAVVISKKLLKENIAEDSTQTQKS
jgi:hypothetical protein